MKSLFVQILMYSILVKQVSRIKNLELMSVSTNLRISFGTKLIHIH